MGRSAEVAAEVPRQPASLIVLAAGGAATSVSVGLLERGIDNFAAPLRVWLGDITLVGSATSFLRSFISDLRIYSPTVRHHPPGFLLALWIFDWVHGQGYGWAMALPIIGAALIPPCIVRLLPRTRWVVVAAVALPALLWPAPEPAALFAGATLLAVVLIVRGRGVVSAIAGGVALGGALMLTYVALAGALAVVVTQNRKRRLAALATSVALLALVRVAGFSWWTGIRSSL